MVDEAEKLISEIQQIKAQYVAEVGNRRRVWPRSIKERVARLDELGVPAKNVASRTGISYETIILWRYNRRKETKKSFHEVKVGNPPALRNGAGISKSGAVTVSNNKMPLAAQVPVLRLTTPNGFVIDGLDESTIVRLVWAFRSEGGRCAP